MISSRGTCWSGWDGLVKITDFGIAHAVGETPVTQPVTQPGMLIGTPAYLAPERITGVLATPATDLYALGVVAHQCLTGQVPFAGEPLAVALAHLDRGIPALPGVCATGRSRARCRTHPQGSRGPAAVGHRKPAGRAPPGDLVRFGRPRPGRHDGGSARAARRPACGPRGSWFRGSWFWGGWFWAGWGWAGWARAG